MPPSSELLSTSAAQELPNDEIVVALIENRACEVGVALFNLDTFQIAVGQLSDTVGFSKTVSFLSGRSPSNFVFAHTSTSGNLLFQTISDNFSDAALTAVNRRVFNDVKGAQRLLELTSGMGPIGFISDSSHYLALSAAAAVIQFVEDSLLCVLVPNTIRVTVVELSHYVSIDRASAIALQILPGHASRAKDSLLSLCDHTMTPVGARLLRSNIIQPIRDVPTLTLRQDAVISLLKDTQLLSTIRNALGGCAGLDFDRIIAVFSRQYDSRALGESAAQSVIASAISLRTVMHQVSILGESLNRHITPPFGILSTISATIAECEVKSIVDFIDTHFDTSIVASGGANRPMGALAQVQHCFGLRSPDVYGLLDVKRREFSDAIECIFKLCDSLRTKYSAPNLRVTYRAPRGYAFSIPLAEEQQLPPCEFHSKVYHPKHLSCLSSSLAHLNDRIFTSTRDILSACGSALSSLLPYFWSKVGALQTLSEALALLDLLQSHALLAQSYAHHVCRPSLKDGRITTFEAAFPVLLWGSHRPNTVSLSPENSVIVISGPNGSGKTTFLKTYSHLIVLSHIGCLLPAKMASVAMADRIIAIMPCSDVVDVGTSSFFREMSSLADLAHIASPSTLVLIDELGRGTSSAEGCAISCAASECLADVGCHSILTTHSAHLSRFSVFSPRMQAMHMRVSASFRTLHYHFTLVSGECTLANYGVRLLKSVADNSMCELVSGRVFHFLPGAL